MILRNCECCRSCGDEALHAKPSEKTLSDRGLGAKVHIIIIIMDVWKKDSPSVVSESIIAIELILLATTVDMARQ